MPRARRHPARPPLRPRVLALAVPAAAVLLAATVSGCASPPPAPPPGPPLDPQKTSLVLEAGTRLSDPARILFSWSLDDRDMRLSGRGIARVEPPYHARLDLFLSNGESVVAAALVDDDLRLPPGAPEGIIPPPDLLWAALGVFHPGADAALLGADRPQPGQVRLRYQYPDGRQLRYTTAGGHLLTVELVKGGQVVQRVSLESDESGPYPSEATYRDLAAFRELKITRESVAHVEPYPPDIWTVH